ncbi:MAG: hypothetical protein NTV70_00510 [Acidobacteria bacterium]|nr:hypothetical protein [Acidobacteriota bacterium]
MSTNAMILHLVFAFTLLSGLTVTATEKAMPARPAAVGVATADGAFRVAGLPVAGSSTLTDGAVIESAGTSARVLVNTGGRAELAPGSRMQVHADHLSFESGHALVTGPARVTNREGVLLAQLAPGTSATLEGGSAPSNAVNLSGQVRVLKGELWLADAQTGTQFQLKADGKTLKLLQSSVGKQVSIQGTAAGGNVIQVQTASVLAQAAAASAAGAAAAAVSTKVIIAGVVVAGAASGAAVGLTSNGSNTNATISQ